jgi:adenosylhomocysteinase
MSVIKDISLAQSGRKKIEWVKEHMPLLRLLEDEFRIKRPFEGVKITVSVHLEAKTAYLCKVLSAGGAKLSVTGSNPLSTQDDVAAALADEGIEVYAWYKATDAEYEQHLNMALDFGPEIVIDDGGDLVHLLHTSRSDLANGVIGGCEETTTGIVRLKAREKEGKLRFPMIAVNDAQCKYLFDNRYGTGQSVWDGVMRTTNLVVAGKNVVIAGYGWCGKGVALRAKGLGANVIVTEVDPIKAIEAVMDGFKVMTMADASAIGDFFITVTGCTKVIRREHFLKMKNSAILANAGHFDVEVCKTDLKNISLEVKPSRNNIEGYVLEDGRILYLLAEGRLVNLAAGDGHPAEIMDLSFTLQALSARYILENRHSLKPGVYNVPPEIDNLAAEMKLNSMGINIDGLTDEQKAYLGSY